MSNAPSGTSRHGLKPGRYSIRAMRTSTAKIFSSFLTFVLRKELERRLKNAGYVFEWTDLKPESGRIAVKMLSYLESAVVKIYQCGSEINK